MGKSNIDESTSLLLANVEIHMLMSNKLCGVHASSVKLTPCKCMCNLSITGN